MPLSRQLAHRAPGPQHGSAAQPTPKQQGPAWRRLPSLPQPPRRSLRCRGLGEQFDKFKKAVEQNLDFESWAPRSSQAWRLGQQPSRQSSEGGMSEASIDILNERLESARRSGTGGLSDEEEEQPQQPQAAATPAAAAAAAAAEQEGAASGEEDAAFTSATDADVADALNRRIVQVAESLSLDEGDGEEGDAEVLTGTLLRQLLESKYGKAHDCAFVKRDIPGKTLVSLNILYHHYGMRSFPMSEADYLDKLDGIATYLRAWGQDEKVMAFLRVPPKARNGLPARPVVGTAVAVPLDLDAATIAEWFPSR